MMTRIIYSNLPEEEDTVESILNGSWHKQSWFIIQAEIDVFVLEYLGRLQGWYDQVSNKRAAGAVLINLTIIT